MLGKIDSIVYAIERTFVTMFMLIATIFTIVQVIARYVFNNSIYWSEELVLYSLISMSFLTMSMGLAHAVHIKVEVLYAFVSPRMLRFLQIFASIGGMCFAGMIIYYSMKLSMNTLNMGQLSPSMHLPMGYVYMVIPFSGILMFIRYCLLLFQDLSNKNMESLAEDKELYHG